MIDDYGRALTDADQIAVLAERLRRLANMFDGRREEQAEEQAEEAEVKPRAKRKSRREPPGKTEEEAIAEGMAEFNRDPLWP